MLKHEDNAVARINGNNLQPLAGVSVTVTDKTTNLPAFLYADDGTTPLTQPLITNDNGYYGFKAPDGTYLLTFSGQRIATFTREIVLDDPKDNPYATKADLAAGTGASLVTFTQAGVGAVPRDWQSRGREELYLTDFGAAGDGMTDDTAAIQKALDARTGNVIVLGGGKPYKTTDSIYVRNNQKGIDLQGGQILFDASKDNIAAVVIDNPTSSPTLYQSLENMYIYGVGSTSTRTGIKGLLIKDGVHHPTTRNIGIQIANADAFVIQGGAVGGNDTPYYGLHENIKTQLCGNGIIVQAPDGAPRITTHTFVNPVSGGHTGRGVYLKNAEFITLDAPHLEQNSAANLRFEDCGTNYVIGGFHENTLGPRVEYVNQDPLRSNIILADVYPSTPDGTGTRVATYYQNPALGMQSNAILLERASSMQVLFAADDVLELKFAGIVTIQTDQSTFLRAYLNGGSIDVIESGGTNTALWAFAQNTASKINLYASGGKYYVQNKTASGIFFRFFTQVGF